MRKLILLLVAMCLTTFSFAQLLLNPQQEAKMDSLVRTGRLGNGLTYYIRYNNNPEKRAEFYIATNVGAINETPAQRGLAHFLEHMCFNGNKDFPGNTMMSYLEKNGLIFGANINAMTGVEQTIYTLNAIPTVREALVDTALVILQNDAAFVTNSFDEIEKERGVIIEEWRSGNTAQRRQSEALFKGLYKGTKYADCNVIGDEECLLAFDPQELVNFYKTWYYPANQAIIVCGDVDVDYIENKIKELFSIIPAKENPPVKEVIKVPDNEEPIAIVHTDPEIMVTTVTGIIKMERMPVEYNKYGIGILQGIIKNLIEHILNERFNDASQAASAPFIQPGSSFQNLMQTMEGFIYACAAKDNNGLAALEGMIGILRQAQQYGFTQAEYDRAKTALLRRYQAAVDNAPTRTNSAFANACVNNFLENMPIMDPAYRKEVVEQYLSMLNVEAINATVAQLIVPQNNVILYATPAKEGVAVPSEEEVVAAFKTAYQAEVAPLENNEVVEPLLDPATIKAGKIKKESKGFLGATVLSLSNGVNVYVYPTDVRKDQVNISLIQNGGASLLPEEILPSFDDNVQYLYHANSGVSKFSQTQLKKMLTGKRASVSTFVNETNSGVSGSGSPKDLETIMQLIWLNYTQPRCDADEFAVSLAQLKAVAGNLASSPDIKFGQMVNDVENNYSPRAPFISAELIEKVSAEDINKGNQLLFGDAVGSKVFIVGDVDIDALKPLVEKYIASLPVKSKKERAIVDHKLYPADGVIEKVESFKMENPNTKALVMYHAPAVKNVDNNTIMRALSYIMDMRYIESLREEDGGTYSPRVSGSVTNQPHSMYEFSVMFETQYEKSQALLDKVYTGFEKFAGEGPTEEELLKTSQMLKKNISESEKSLSYWNNLIESYYRYGLDMQLTDEIVDRNVTKEKVQELAQSILNQGNKITVVLNPEK